VQFAEFSKDGTRIVTTTDDGVATIWEAQSGRPVESYYVFDPDEGTGTNPWKRDLSTARFDRDGTRIVLGVGDGSIRIWSPVNKSYNDLISTALRKRSLTEVERKEFDLE
jgi:WD40 repeat protein